MATTETNPSTVGDASRVGHDTVGQSYHGQGTILGSQPQDTQASQTGSSFWNKTITVSTKRVAVALAATLTTGGVIGAGIGAGIATAVEHAKHKPDCTAATTTTTPGANHFTTTTTHAPTPHETATPGATTHATTGKKTKRGDGDDLASMTTTSLVDTADSKSTLISITPTAGGTATQSMGGGYSSFNA